LIIFKYLRFKNFLSSGNVFTEIDFRATNSTLVVGENGAGKTTFVDALCYALYNKAFRNINKPQLVNSITKKALLVEVEFDVNNRSYLVRRGMRPNIFDIFRNGKLINQTTGTLDYQAILEKQILKINFKAFTQIVVLGSANYTPFMQLPAGSRREVIEDLLDIQVFSVMNNLLKDKVTKNKTDLQAVEYDLDLTTSKLDLARKHILALQENNAELIKDRETKMATYRKDIADRLDTEEEEGLQFIRLEDEYKALKRKERGLVKLEFLQDKIASRIKKLETTIQFYTENASCPTCKQDITPDFKETKIADTKNQIEEVKTGLADLEGEVAELYEIKQKVGEIGIQMDEVSKNINHSQALRSSFERSINELAEEIEQLKNKNQDIQNDDALIAELISKIGTCGEDKSELLNERELLTTAGLLLKDGGIKTKIVKQYIPVMNKLINQYLSKLEFFAAFELDENFNEVIKSRFRDEFSYESFSEGEKVRINLAILFAWMAIARLRNSANCSLLVMDEILDGSMDVQGIELLLFALKDIIKDKNVFVISHNWNMQNKFDRTLEFKKSKNFSRIAS
jgi:DNA repair exonuclease SbcCD ATPase subunit